MPPSTSDFWKRLTDQRIATDQECREWAAEIVTHLGPGAIADARLIADALVARGTLTSYQATLLLEDIPVPLTRGRFILRSNLDKFPFRNWKAARGESEQDRWLYFIDVSLEQLNPATSNLPSVSRLQLHTKTRGSHLLPIEGFEFSGQTLIVIVAPIVGACLSEKLPARGMAWHETIAVVQALSAALQVLHRNGIVHGEVLLDRVWRKPDGSYLLLRDPMYPPRSPLGEQPLTCFESSNLVPCYAAPEFFVPGYSHTYQTDIYALGALWFHLLTGLPPFAKEPPATRMEAITAKSLSIPKSIGLPAALRDCLAYLLAKNPSSRFHTIAQFDEAFRLALKLARFEDADEPSLEPPPVTPQSTTANPIAATGRLSTLPQPSNVPPNRPKQSEASAAQNGPTIADESRSTPLPASNRIQPIQPAHAASSSSSGNPVSTAPLRGNASGGDVEQPTPELTNGSREVAEQSKSETSPKQTAATNAEVPKSASVKQPPMITKPTTTSKSTNGEPRPASPEMVMKNTSVSQQKVVPLSTDTSQAVKSQAMPTSKIDIRSVVEAPQKSTTLQTELQLDKPIQGAPQPVSLESNVSELSPPPQTSLQQSAPERSSVSQGSPAQGSPVQGSPLQAKSQQAKSRPSEPKQARAQTAKPRVHALPRNSISRGRRSQTRKERPVWLVPSIVGGSLLLLAGLVLLITRRSSVSDHQQSASQSAVNTASADGHAKQIDGDSMTSSSSDATPLSRVFDIVEDENSFAWAPPLVGQPVNLELLPPGANGFLFVRPGAWLDLPVGRSIVELFEPELQRAWQTIEDISGLPASELESIAVGLFPGEDGWPSLTYRFEMKESRSLSRMRELWPGASEETIDKTKMLVRKGYYYFLSHQPLVDAMTVKQFAVGSKDRMSSLAELRGGVATQRPTMADMLEHVDSRYDLTIVFSPSFLHTDGTQLLPTWFPLAASELEQILSNRARSCLIATQLSPRWYGEFRLKGESDLDAPRMIESWKRRMRELPDLVEASLVRTPPHEYWRALAMRFPQMLRSLARNQRYSVEQGTAITNFYLTEQAAPNLLFSSWLAMQNTSTSTSGISPNSKSKPRPWTPDEILARPLSIAFDQESLEAALQLIAEEVNRDLPEGTTPLKFEIVNPAFEKSGITRNQQVRDFRYENKPLREILVALALRVNPDRSVSSPKDPKLAVVWRLDATTKPDQPTVQFTTRIFAEESKQRIADDFAL